MLIFKVGANFGVFSADMRPRRRLLARGHEWACASFSSPGLLDFILALPRQRLCLFLRTWPTGLFSDSGEGVSGRQPG